MSKKIITTIVPILLAISILFGVIFILARISQKDSRRLEAAALENYLKDRTIEANRSSELLRLLKNDMQRLALNQTILTYFTNIDLGMSEKYGLGYSKYQIRELFKNYLDYQILDNEFFYRQILFTDSNGEIIVSESQGDLKLQDSNTEDVKNILSSEFKEGKLIGFIDEKSYNIMYVQPVTYRGDIRGKLVTVINNYIYFPLKHMSESSQMTILTIPGLEEYLYNYGIGIVYDVSTFPKYNDLKTNVCYKLNVKDMYGTNKTVVLSRMMISDTELEMFNVKPFELVYTKPDHKVYTWTVIILGFILMALLFVLERVHLKNHALSVKLKTRAEQNIRFKHKNKELNVEIEKRKLIEEELYESRIKAEFLAKEAQQANRSKSLFLANMSHDVRTPMNSIIGFTDILLENIEEQQNREFLKHIKNSAAYLLNIINDVLDISKIESGSMELVGIITNTKEFFHDLYSLFTPECKDKDISFKLEIDDNVPQNVIVDYQKLKQVLVNLMNNAVKFTDKGYVKCKVSFTDGNLLLRVEDTGVGIPKAFYPNMFEPFKQVKGQDHNKYGGTGLGLAITKRMIDLMRGEITFKSESGKGTIFMLVIPVEIAENFKEKNESEGAANTSVDKKYNILIAEDNYVNQRLIGFLIKSLNHRFDIVDNGQKVLEKLHAGNKYDMLLLDIQMPIMDGYETLEMIRSNKNYNNLYIIALTAQAMSGDKERILEKGANDYVSKPIDKKKLVESINKYASYKVNHDKKHI